MSRIPFLSHEKLSLEGLQSEMSNLVKRWWHCGVNTGPLDGQDWAPPIEICDEPGAYRVTIELPGVDRSAIAVTAQEASLVISGEKIEPVRGTGDDAAEGDVISPAPRVVYGERRYGRFRRPITLPGPVRSDEVTATLSEGVLSVLVPKAGPARPNEIRVEIQAPSSTL